MTSPGAIGMRFLTSATIAYAALVCLSCDDHPDLTKAVANANPAATLPASEPSRPTTQALLENPRKLLHLNPLQLTMDVPSEWSMQTIGGYNVLTGPAPVGDVTIQLNARTMAAEKIAQIAVGAQAEMKERPDTFLMARSRNINGVNVFERQRITPAADRDESPAFSWTISAYIPTSSAEAKDVYVYELNFIGLTQQQFQADKDFLNKIVDSLKAAP